MAHNIIKVLESNRKPDEEEAFFFSSFPAGAAVAVCFLETMSMTVDAMEEAPSGFKEVLEAVLNGKVASIHCLGLYLI